MRDKNNSTWIVVGGSPNVTTYFDEVMDAHPDATTITCNAGAGPFLDRQRTPDYFYLQDPNAFTWWGANMRAVHAAGATALSKSGREKYVEKVFSELPAARLELLDLRHTTYPPKYEQRRMVWPRYSGLVCIQYALHHGATTVVMLGFEGYKSSEQGRVIDNFDGRLGPVRGKKRTEQWTATFVASCIAQRPDVQFEFWGEATYELPRAPNVTVICGAAPHATAPPDRVLGDFPGKP